MQYSFAKFLPIAALALFPILGICGEQMSARCISNASCTSDEYAADFLWTAREIIDQKSKSISEQQAHLMEACFVSLASEVTLHFFDKRTVTRQAYLNKAKLFSAKLRDPKSDLKAKLLSAFTECPDGTLSPDEFFDFLTNSILHRRPLTDLSDFRADWRAFEGRTLRFSGVGKYVQGILFLQSSPGDLSPVRVDVSRLSKSTVSDLIKQCSNIRQQCRITLWAKSWPDHSFTDIQSTGTIEFN